jgi:predicted DNA-binding ribbon-helix-helix protein
LNERNGQPAAIFTAETCFMLTQIKAPDGRCIIVMTRWFFWWHMSNVIKRSIVIEGHKTSVSLEDEFWFGFKEIAAAEKTAISALAEIIERSRPDANLSSAIRLHVLSYYRSRAVAAHHSNHN